MPKLFNHIVRDHRQLIISNPSISSNPTGFLILTSDPFTIPAGII